MNLIQDSYECLEVARPPLMHYAALNNLLVLFLKLDGQAEWNSCMALKGWVWILLVSIKSTLLQRQYKQSPFFVFVFPLLSASIHLFNARVLISTLVCNGHVKALGLMYKIDRLSSLKRLALEREDK